MVKNYPFYALAVSLFILGLSLGFFAGKQLSNQQQIIPLEEATDLRQETNKLFTTQTATIRGEISKVESNNLTVKNLNNNETGDIVASTRLTVISNGKTSTTSDFSSLELNKEVLIGLEAIGGVYQAVSIQYPQSTPSLPSITASPKALTLPQS